MGLLKHQWFAIQVKSKREKAVALALNLKGYEEFLPLCHQKRRKSSESTEAPLFPGYLFCRLDSNVCGPIVTTPGVIRIVGCGSRSFPIADEEIHSIRCIINSHVQPIPWPYLRIGERVRIEEGALAGVSGFIVRVRNSTRIVVSINLLQRSVAVEINSSAAVPLRGVFPDHSRDQLAGIVGQTRPSCSQVPAPEDLASTADAQACSDFSAA